MLDDNVALAPSVTLPSYGQSTTLPSLLTLTTLLPALFVTVKILPVRLLLTDHKLPAVPVTFPLQEMVL